MRVVFAGTPAVAIPSLEAVAVSRHELVAVLTRPDAPSGRGRRVTRSPVAAWAAANGARLLQPERPSRPDFLAELAELAPDCVPVVAYGALIPHRALDVPGHGWVNLHFSLLPAWRGAAPVQRAVMAGDEVTGATTFRLEEGLDTGPVYGLMTETVRPRDTAGDLLERLAIAGASLLVATLDGIEDGVLVPHPQALGDVSLAPKVGVEEARVNWSLPAAVVDRRVRGCTPAPGAWTVVRGNRVKLGPVTPAPIGEEAAVMAPGRLAADRGRVLVGTATGPVTLGVVQPPGKRAMPAADWARGARIEPGETFE